MTATTILVGEVMRNRPDEEAAILFKPDGDCRGEEFWIPRSLVVNDDVDEHPETEIEVQTWWLRKKGVID